MSDIFISYASEDRSRAQMLAQTLEREGWSTFWDRTIPIGMSWRQVIGKELADARCVVVLWSQASIDSTWVQEEADEGQRREILIPILIEDVLPPIGFRGAQAGDLSDWDGTQATPMFQRLVSDIARIIGPPPREAEERERAAPEASARKTIAAGETFRDRPACPEMIVVPAGHFMMGSPDSDSDAADDERPQHPVTISQAFAMGRYEVTFEEWDACIAGGGCKGHRPDDEGWGRGLRPVVNVSWDDVQAYVTWLRKKTGKPYRLPSEAEWEYAARAGSTARYWWGNDIGRNNANCDGCGSRWDDRRTAPVDSFRPNDFGLYDTAGNVWEWVEDCWNESYHGAPSDGSAWLDGDCSSRVLRGGSWSNYPWVLRSASRNWFRAGNRVDNFGFRVARTLP